MNAFLSLICFSVCISFCSVEKVIDKKKEEDTSYDKYKKKVYKGRPEYSKDYIDFLREQYNILPDPPKVKEPLPNALLKPKPTEKVPEKIETDNMTTVEEMLQNGTSCRSCDIREEDKQMRLKTIRNSILNQLGFSDVNTPNMTGKTYPEIPSLQRLKQQFGMQSDSPYSSKEDYYPEDDMYGQIQRAYTISQPPPEKFGINVEGAFYFDIPESVRSKKVQEATLWVYMEPPTEHHKHHSKKHVTEIFLYTVPENSKPKYLFKGPVRYKKTSTYGWQEFKLTHTVHHWLKRESSNRGLIIRTRDSDGRNLAVTAQAGQDEKKFPMLEMSTVDHKGGRRNKRSTPNICDDEHRSDTCCRWPLRVDFIQFGWDWVIAPTGYQANYCSGECRYRHLDNSPQAYLIQQTSSEGTGPCCTPSQHDPLAMLYFDHEHTILYTYMQGMVVQRCKCA